MACERGEIPDEALVRFLEKLKIRAFGSLLNREMGHVRLLRLTQQRTFDEII